jgi:hypothetical protein
MARIPLGNFGNRAAAPAVSGPQLPAATFGTDLAGPLAQGLDVAAQAFGVQERKQEAEDKQRRAEANRLQAVTAQAEIKNHLADVHDDIAAGLTDGRYDKTKAGEIFNTESRKRIDKVMEGVAPENRELVNASLVDDIGRTGRGVRQMVAKKDMQDIRGGIDSYLEQMQRYATRGDAERVEAIGNVDTFIRASGAQAGMAPHEIEKTLAGFKEGVTFTLLDKQVTAAQRDGKALGKLSTALASDQFAELDPAKRNFLDAKVQRYQQHLAQMGEIAERRRLSKLNTMATRLSWYVENGRDIPPTEFDAFNKASKGTPMEGFASQIAAEQKATAEFSRLTPQQMTAKVNELAASYGKTPTKEQITHLGKMQNFVQTSIKAMHSAPLEYAAQREGAVVEPLDFSKPDTWASNLQNRAEILKEQSKRTGAAPKGLMQQEAAMLSKFLAEGSDAAKTETLKMLRKGFGDDKVFRATMQQIAADSPVTALAGMVATRERPMKISGFFSDETFTPGSTAGLMLAGERILNPGKDAKGQDGKPTFPMPKDADIRLKFNSMAGDAFAGNQEAYQIAYQAARATYAGLVAQKGDYSGALNDGILKEAIQRSTGGVADINGARVVKPWGMDDSTFKNTVKREFIGAVKQAGIPQTADQWPRMQLQNTKGGYLVKSGTGYLLGKDGNPVMLRVTDPNDPSGMADRIPK